MNFQKFSWQWQHRQALRTSALTKLGANLALAQLRDQALHSGSKKPKPEEPNMSKGGRGGQIGIRFVCTLTSIPMQMYE